MSCTIGAWSVQTATTVLAVSAGFRGFPAVEQPSDKHREDAVMCSEKHARTMLGRMIDVMQVLE